MTRKKRYLFSYLLLALALVVLFAANLFWGSVALTPGAVLAALTGRGQDALSVGIITQLRMPRAVMVVLLGAALSAAGYLLQTFFANPIAGPFVMGISSGAKLAVALVMVMFLNHGLLTSSLTLILAAFAGAMAAMAFVLAVARRVQRMSILVICGVMIGYICSAVTEFVVAFAQDSNIVNLGQCTGGGTGGAACAGSSLLPLQTHERLPDGRSLCPERGREREVFFQAAGTAFQSAGGLCHGLCGAHLLCGHRSAASGQAAAGQRKAAGGAAGLLPGRGSLLFAVRPDRPQPVCSHGAFHQRGHRRVWCAGGHRAAHPPEPGGCTMKEFLCETQELAIGYGKMPLASGIALGANPGQILVLVGPNGAGKSTLLKTLAGQLAPLGGTVLLDGQDLTAYTGTARAQKLALMLPHTRRTELTTCFEFAAAGRIPYTGRLGILSDADRQTVQDALEIAGAAHLADRDFNCISDGQRQRVLLARAICQQPKVLLLDEPTSFLDIKGKIELLTILQKLAHEQGLAVIVSLHELDMAQKIADAVVCVFQDHVSGVLTPDAAFAPDNIRALYALSEAQYTALFGQAKPQKPTFEHYVRSGQKLLRCGYTTGTCAALGAAGAARLLLTGHAPETVALRTPKGIVVEVAPLFCRRTDTGAECAIEKDGGDDVDVTTGLPVIATVELLPGCTDIRIDGGRGVGRVTKPGLDQPVGAAAINHVPRQMIAEALRREAEAACYTGGFSVTVSIQNGEEVARRTFNPHIGVEGGLSVLGTSGIVEPMSQQAILDTIQLEMNQAVLRAGTPKRLILAPGNYGLDYLHDTYPAFAAIPVVKTSNFIGDTLDMAASAGFEQVLLVGHVGKLVKVAGGIMNTHSHTADCRTELFCTHAALCGAGRELCAALYAAATTDACLELLDAAGLRAPVLESLLDAIQLHLDRRAGEAFRVGAVLFSNQHGPLGATQTAKELLEQWNNA